MPCTEKLHFVNAMGFDGFFFYKEDLFSLIDLAGGPLRTPIMWNSEQLCDEFSNWNFQPLLMERPWKKKERTIERKKYLLNYKSNEFKQKSTEETLPWGVTAQGINASRKLHGRGMIVCKQKENNNKQTNKKRQNNWIQCYRQTGDRCVNMLCRVSKGISFFF